jgi:hypothetical protein
MTNKVRGSIIDFPEASSSFPVSGNYTAGQVVYNTEATGPTGWRCVVSGNPGTWTVFGETILEASATWDPPSMIAGGLTSTTLSVPGAALGDYASVSISADQAGCNLIGYVSAANTVSVSLVNVTSGTVNIGSSTLRVRVKKQ